MLRLNGRRQPLARVGAAEHAVMRLLPGPAREGTTWFGTVGDIVQQPPAWGTVAAGLALAGGAPGRRAAARGAVCYGASAVVANVLIKPFVRRSRPTGAGKRRPGPLTSSFPSGHAATELSFAFGAAQEIPWLLVPLAGATVAAHWSLVRSRGHYPSDVLVGGAVGIAVALALQRVWPPHREDRDITP